MKRYVSLVLLLVTLIGCGQTSTSTIQKPSSISSTSYDSQTSIGLTTTTSNASSSSIDEYYEPIEGVFTIKDFLKTNGDQFNNGYGDEIVLRGTNAGGYLVTERWMCAFAKPHYSSSETNLPESQTNW